jgi:hypothetical protein
MGTALLRCFLDLLMLFKIDKHLVSGKFLDLSFNDDL